MWEVWAVQQEVPPSFPDPWGPPGSFQHPESLPGAGKKGAEGRRGGTTTVRKHFFALAFCLGGQGNKKTINIFVVIIQVLFLTGSYRIWPSQPISGKLKPQSCHWQLTKHVFTILISTFYYQSGPSLPQPSPLTRGDGQHQAYSLQKPSKLQ